VSAPSIESTSFLSSRYRSHPPAGHAVTKLKEDCGAIIGWYARLAIPDDIIGFGGDVPPAVMAQIDDAVRRDLVRLVGQHFETVRAMFEELLGDEE
jgi:hypothetical protein